MPFGLSCFLGLCLITKDSYFSNEISLTFSLFSCHCMMSFKGGGGGGGCLKSNALNFCCKTKLLKNSWIHYLLIIVLTTTIINSIFCI